jgi:hypothetical protein
MQLPAVLHNPVLKLFLFLHPVGAGRRSLSAFLVPFSHIYDLGRQAGQALPIGLAYLLDEQVQFARALP